MSKLILPCDRSGNHAFRDTRESSGKQTWHVNLELCAGKVLHWSWYPRQMFSAVFMSKPLWWEQTQLRSVNKIGGKPRNYFRRLRGLQRDDCWLLLCWSRSTLNPFRWRGKSWLNQFSSKPTSVLLIYLQLFGSLSAETIINQKTSLSFGLHVVALFNSKFVSF